MLSCGGNLQFWLRALMKICHLVNVPIHCEFTSENLSVLCLVIWWQVLAQPLVDLLSLKLKRHQKDPSHLILPITKWRLYILYISLYSKLCFMIYSILFLINAHYLKVCGELASRYDIFYIYSHRNII